MTRSNELKLEERDEADFALMVSTLTTINRRNKIDDTFVAEVVKNLCALLNTQGGRLKIGYDESLDLSERAHKDFIRKVEQHVREISDYSTIRLMSIEINYPHYDMFHLKPSASLCTMNYNLCVPTETQILSLPSTEPSRNISEILRRKRLSKNSVFNGTHCQKFVMGTAAELRESKTVQVKVIKAQPSKCVSLADRIINRSNKLVNLVSAFANHKGGHLYIGIDSLTYRVEGIHVTDSEQCRICSRVTKALGKMVWPEQCMEPSGKETEPVKPIQNQLSANERLTPRMEVQDEALESESEQDDELNRAVPKRGIHWDIHFEPVLNTEGHEIPDIYIIVIYIAPTPGGVFFEEPESYHVLDGEVKRMHFEDWKRKLTPAVITDFRTELGQQFSKGAHAMVVPTHGQLSGYLQRLRKDGEWNAFESLASKLSMLSNPSVLPVVAYERTLAAITKQEVMKASKNFNDFCEYSISKGVEEHYSNEIYLRAMLACSKGEYEESYNTLKKGLGGFSSREYSVWTTAAFYSLFASVAAIRSADEEELNVYSEESVEYNKEALNILERYKCDNQSTLFNDFRQVIHINMALFCLRSSVKCFNERHTVDVSDIQVAWSYLTLAQRPCVGARGMTKYNVCMCLLAESDLQYRMSQVYPLHQLIHIESAFTLATKAREIARGNGFLELLAYCFTRLSLLTEQLVRGKLDVRKLPSKEENMLRTLSDSRNVVYL